jgi:hypothetical protein
MSDGASVPVSARAFESEGAVHSKRDVTDLPSALCDAYLVRVTQQRCREGLRALAPLLYVNIGAMPGSAFAIARRYAGRSPMRSR